LEQSAPISSSLLNLAPVLRIEFLFRGMATLSTDGRVVYVEGAVEQPTSHLRVVPRWVDRMKRAVDDANRVGGGTK
jgi:hypothetical protein